MPRSTLGHDSDLPALVSYIRAGRCILFVGAGLSAGAGYPTWTELVRRLVERTSAELRSEAARQELDELMSAGRLREVADFCRSVLGEDGLHSMLCAELARRPGIQSATHRAVVETPFACIVTTNYDSLLEDGYARWGARGIPRAPTGRDLAKLGTLLLDGAFFILKAHGDLGDAESIVLTAEDYRRIIHANPAFQAVLSSLLLTHAVLFVGYSLNDPNFRLLLDGQLTTFGEDVPGRYALMSGVGEVERDVLWRTARLRVFSYEENRHECVGEFLADLASRCQTPLTTTASWRVPHASRSHAQAAGASLGAPPPLDLASLKLEMHHGSLELTWQPSTCDGAAPSRSLATLADWGALREGMGRALGAGATLADVARMGGLLAERFPSGVLAELEALPEEHPLSLSLSPELEALPWEWLLAGGMPLCIRRPVVRRPVGISDAARGMPFARRPLRVLLIGDPGHGSAGRVVLPGSREEVRGVERVLEDASSLNQVQALIGAQATYESVLHELATGDYDIVHFAGHAWFADSDVFLELNDGDLWASELSSLLSRRPPTLMMLTSHYTSFVPPGAPDVEQVTGDESRLSTLEELARHRARGFTRLASRSGVGAFIGCFGSPTDAGAAVLATELYRFAMQGVPIALALHRARAIAMQGGDVSATMFTLSGYPQLVLA
ncbi:MAG TPA: SIR2 family protein [Gemmatimonadales bacterium]